MGTTFLKSLDAQCIYPEELVLYGPSTTNKRWWRKLHDHLAKFQSTVVELLTEWHYNPHNLFDRQMMYVLHFSASGSRRMQNVYQLPEQPSKISRTANENNNSFILFS